MNDDLVKILRSDASYMQKRFGLSAERTSVSIAADRIEALETQLAEAEARAIRLGEAVRDFYVNDLEASAKHHMHGDSMYAGYLREKIRAIRAIDPRALLEQVK